MAPRWPLCALLLSLCIWLPPAYGRQGIVRTRDGRTLEGDVVEQGTETVTVKLKAGSITLPSADVASIIYADSITEVYQERLKALPRDAGGRGHMELARWLYENKAYELARKEVDVAISMEPNNSDAVVLKQTIDRTMMWERTKNNPASSANSATKPANPVVKDTTVITLDQMNYIKQRELGANEPLNAMGVREVERRYVKAKNLQPREFFAKPRPAQLAEILKDGGAEYANDIRIANDPHAIMMFKRAQPVILAGCATAACHSGPNAGTFVLKYPATTDVATYTNFYVLRKYSTDVEGAQAKALVLANPDRSLIVQFGLPPEKAELKHPPAKGYKPVFTSLEDPKLVPIRQWIQHGLQPTEPDYTVEFPVHTSRASTQPIPPDQPPVPPPAPDQPPPRNPNDRRPPDNRQQTDRTNPNQPPPNDRLKDARDRIRPINPGPIVIPPLPF